MQRKQQVTLQEIGRAAGVSAPTVSRVLNRHPGVSGEVRSRVMEAIEALGYDAEPILRKAAVISNAQMHERRIEIVMFPLPEQNDIFKLSYFNEIYEGCLSVLNQSGTARASLLTWERSWRGTASLPAGPSENFFTGGAVKANSIARFHRNAMLPKEAALQMQFTIATLLVKMVERNARRRSVLPKSRVIFP